jgi:hypothetical protein
MDRGRSDLDVNWNRTGRPWRRRPERLGWQTALAWGTEGLCATRSTNPVLTRMARLRPGHGRPVSQSLPDEELTRELTRWRAACPGVLKACAPPAAGLWPCRTEGISSLTWIGKRNCPAGRTPGSSAWGRGACPSSRCTNGSRLRRSKEPGADTQSPLVSDRSGQGNRTPSRDDLTGALRASCIKRSRKTGPQRGYETWKPLTAGASSRRQVLLVRPKGPKQPDRSSVGSDQSRGTHAGRTLPLAGTKSRQSA